MLNNVIFNLNLRFGVSERSSPHQRSGNDKEKDVFRIPNKIVPQKQAGPRFHGYRQRRFLQREFDEGHHFLEEGKANLYHGTRSLFILHLNAFNI